MPLFQSVPTYKDLVSVVKLFIQLSVDLVFLCSKPDDKCFQVGTLSQQLVRLVSFSVVLYTGYLERFRVQSFKLGHKFILHNLLVIKFKIINELLAINGLWPSMVTHLFYFALHDCSLFKQCWIIVMHRGKGSLAVPMLCSVAGIFSPFCPWFILQFISILVPV